MIVVSSPGTWALTSDLPNIAGTSVYDPLLRVKDTQFLIKNAADTTKKWQLDLANLITATTRTDSVPNASTMLAGLATANVFRTGQDVRPASDVVLYHATSPSGAVADAFELYSTDNAADAAEITSAGDSYFNTLNLGTSAGANIRIQNKSALSGSKTYSIDNSLANTDFALTGGTQTFTGTKTLNVGTLRTDGTTSHIAFNDFSSSTKIMALNCSQLTAGSTRIDTVQDVSGMLVVRRNARDFTSQTANFTATNIATTPAAGFYTVQVYGAADNLLGGAITITLAWTDPVQAQTATAVIAATAGSIVTMNLPVQVASGSITVATTGYITGTYEVRCRVIGQL